MTSESQATRPTLRIVRGNPSAEDVATIVAVLSAAAVAEETSARQVSGWGTPSAMHRPEMSAPGPGAWLRLGHR